MARPPVDISPLFASPVASTLLPDADSLNTALRRLFLAMEAEARRAPGSVPTDVVKVGVYESDFYLFNRQEPEIRTLANFCLQTLGYLIAQLNGFSAEEMAALRIYNHCWFHVTRHQGYTAAHNHPMASWSGVYCVDPGDPPSERPNSGALRFMEARTTAGMYLDPGNAYLRSPYTFGDTAYQLAAGQLLLFPSYLLHEVAPYHGQRERITVAFNAWVRYADEPAGEPSLRKRQ